jgi:hypothetical protein
MWPSPSTRWIMSDRDRRPDTPEHCLVLAGAESIWLPEWNGSHGLFDKFELNSVKAAQPSAPSAIISALRRYPAARPWRRQSAGCASI